LTSRFLKKFYEIKVNPLRENGQLIFHLNSLKIAERSDAKKREAKLRVKNKKNNILTRSFASRFFASLRSAIFTEIQVYI